MEDHKFVFSKHIGKQYCVKCGLVRLNNSFSNWAVDKGCNNELHPSHSSTKHKNTRLF